MQIGHFEDVVAVGVADQILSIVDADGKETLIGFHPPYDRDRRAFVEPRIDGTFGEMEGIKEGAWLDNVELYDIVAINITQSRIQFVDKHHSQASWGIHRVSLM